MSINIPTPAFDPGDFLQRATADEDDHYVYAVAL